MCNRSQDDGSMEAREAFVFQDQSAPTLTLDTFLDIPG